MLDRLAVHLAQTGLIPSGSPVVVGCSGGADSVCLVDLLHRLQADVIVAHLHHGLRPEADDEMARVQAFADSRSLPFVGGRADVPAIARESRIGIEEAGREARKSFLRQAAFRLGSPAIATAHTQDDHLETILFRLARGTSLEGLQGIAPAHEGFIRPLLPFTRAETRAWCLENGLWFHDDPSNSDLSLARARVRHRLLPEFESVHPGFRPALIHLAEEAAAEDRMLNGFAAAALERAEIPLNGELAWLTRDCEAAFDRIRLAAQPEPLLRRGLRLVAAMLGSPLNRDQTLALAEGVIQGGRGAVHSEASAVTAEWTDERVHLRQTRPTEPFRHPLTLPGEVESPEFGWVLEATFGALNPGAGLDARLDPAGLKGTLYFRTVGREDALESGGRRVPIRELDAFRRLTPAARARLPLVCDLVGPVWLPGSAPADRARDSGAERPVHLRLRPREVPDGP
ncbi:MAG: tRNA lysidine(34) synthetase TilS [Fimbriimonadaceae bacterium]|nr:tRNA lysidine(34) synthetase TilS [Fimbriimonadaceae bacterium]